MPADLTGRPERRDIVNAYRLALGRDPESDAVVDDKLGQPNGDWLPSFFKSPEFHDKVYAKALRDGRLEGGHFSSPPPSALVRWAADFIPLSQAGQDGVADAQDWYVLFQGLFCDETFCRSVLGETPPPADDPFLQALEAGHRTAELAHIKGEVESVDERHVRGWALDLRSPDRRLELELYVDGAFVAAGPTSVFRRDIQQRYGGEGRCGFMIQLPARLHDRGAVSGEVREAASKITLGGFRTPEFHAPPLDQVAMIRRELRDLRTLLDRIESRLPAVNAAFAFSLETYGAYFDAYYAPAEALASPGETSVALAVVIDGSGQTAATLQLALESVERQKAYPTEVLLVCDGGNARLEAERLIEQWRRRFGGRTSLAGVFVDNGGWAEAMNAATLQARAGHVLIFPGDGSLAAEATAAVAAALAAGSDLVYADEDEVDATPGPHGANHASPIFRTAFDPDLLLQQDCTGDLIGLPRHRLLHLGFRPEHQQARLYDLALRMSEVAPRGGFTHLPHVLLHRRHPSSGRRPVEPEAMLQAVRDHLARTEPQASVELQDDVLGAGDRPAARIRRPSAQVRAAIIIPTRDRLDLLAPCLASLAAAAREATTPIEILVVDNQSAASETHDFLRDHSVMGEFRLIRHDGAFNWALMNNMAAEQAGADVLVFLNNDTVVLTPDWCDALCANAMRPDVGAVGARLLYEDGTIQHAGVVMSEWHGLTVHEGMGAAGSDPGYLDRHRLVREVSAVTGACLATRASLFREVGGFDALAFPVEGNDTDYCLRLRSQGYRILYDPHATLYHLESKSRGYNDSEAKRRSADQAGEILQRRWAQRFASDPFYNPHFDRLSPPFTRLRPTNLHRAIKHAPTGPQDGVA